MRFRRTHAVLLLALGLVLLGWWGLRLGDGPEDGAAIECEGAVDGGPARLRGTHEPETTMRAAAEEADAAAAEPGPAPVVPGAYDLEVLDYRNAGVPGVEVFHEVDLLDVPSAAGEEWRTVGRGTTDARGRVHFGVDRHRARRPDEGLNHRIRVIPPEAREDLAPTWRLWSAAQGTTFRLTQTHVVAGRVVDRDGEPVWDATVWVGDFREDVRVNNAEWRKTRTDVDGHFRFAGLPTTADWQIEVWAVGPGKDAPASSADVRGWQTVALDARTVEIRLP